jgi:hypothetical protein
MVMASLAFNPVMNIIALPFAMVVSAIAATTVFRNVFTRYDGFSFESSSNASSGHRGLNDTGVLRLGNPRIKLTHGSSHHGMMNDIPLGESKSTYSSHHGGITAHQVVDVHDHEGSQIDVSILENKRRRC